MPTAPRPLLTHDQASDLAPLALTRDGNGCFTTLAPLDAPKELSGRVVRLSRAGGEPVALPAPAPEAFSALSALALSPDDTRLVVGTRAGGAWLLDAASGAALHHLPRSTFSDWVGELDVAPDGASFLVTSKRQVKRFDLATGEALGAVPREALAGWAHARFVSAEVLLVGSDAGAALVRGEAVTPLATPHRQVSRVAVSADRSTLAALVYGALVVWSADGTQRRVHRVRDARALGLAPDGAWAWYLREGGSVVGLEVATGRVAGTVRLLPFVRRNTVFAPNLEQRGDALFVRHLLGLTEVPVEALRTAALGTRTPRATTPGRWEDVTGAADAAARVEAVTRWLAPWATCDETYELLVACLARGDVDTNPDGSMSIEWKEPGVWASFSAPLEGDAALPPPLLSLLRQHNGVRIDDGAPEGLELSPYFDGRLDTQCPLTLDPARWLAFADVEQDWALLDVAEGTVALASHEGGAPTPSLDGPGDLLIRWLAERLEVS